MVHHVIHLKWSVQYAFVSGCCSEKNCESHRPFSHLSQFFSELHFMKKIPTDHFRSTTWWTIKLFYRLPPYHEKLHLQGTSNSSVESQKGIKEICKIRHCSKMFHFEPEGGYRCTKSMAMTDVSNALLVLNRTWLNKVNALLALSRRFVDYYDWKVFFLHFFFHHAIFNWAIHELTLSFTCSLSYDPIS